MDITRNPKRADSITTPSGVRIARNHTKVNDGFTPLQKLNILNWYGHKNIVPGSKFDALQAEAWARFIQTHTVVKKPQGKHFDVVVTDLKSKKAVRFSDKRLLYTESSNFTIDKNSMLGKALEAGKQSTVNTSNFLTKGSAVLKVAQNSKLSSSQTSHQSTAHSTNAISHTPNGIRALRDKRYYDTATSDGYHYDIYNGSSLVSLPQHLGEFGIPLRNGEWMWFKTKDEAIAFLKRIHDAQKENRENSNLEALQNSSGNTKLEQYELWLYDAQDKYEKELVNNHFGDEDVRKAAGYDSNNDYYWDLFDLKDYENNVYPNSNEYLEDLEKQANSVNSPIYRSDFFNLLRYEATPSDLTTSVIKPDFLDLTSRLISAANNAKKELNELRLVRLAVVQDLLNRTNRLLNGVSENQVSDSHLALLSQGYDKADYVRNVNSKMLEVKANEEKLQLDHDATMGAIKSFFGMNLIPILHDVYKANLEESASEKRILELVNQMSPYERNDQYAGWANYILDNIEAGNDENFRMSLSAPNGEVNSFYNNSATSYFPINREYTWADKLFNTDNYFYSDNNPVKYATLSSFDAKDFVDLYNNATEHFNDLVNSYDWSKWWWTSWSKF